MISPWAVTTTDLDSDGDLDLLVGANGENTVYFLENDGNSHFSLLVFTYSANGVSYVYAEDIDGDGHQDVLTATTGDDKITLYLNGSTLPSPNSPPTNLNSTAPLTIAENQPLGSEVGEFNATDPNAGATLTYHLVSGAGDRHNSLFSLDVNGTLKTATTFDYESNVSSYSIRVQAKDEYNATVEGNFTVMLNDVLEYPIYSGFDGNGSTQTTVQENTRDIIPMPFS